MSPAYCTSVFLMWSLNILLPIVLTQEPGEFFNTLHLTTDEDVKQRTSHPARLDDLPQASQHRLEAILQGKFLSDADGSLQDSGALREDKRVFCNGFSGCGGRFRGRRRQKNAAEVRKRLQHPKVSKRPFCNSYGCNNGGKRISEIPSELGDDVTWRDGSDAELPTRFKKLFCNGYGGCQNMGKRILLLPVNSPVRDSNPNPFLPPPVNDVSGQLEKRFWSGGYEDDMNQLVQS
ncbi:uncharacterized protein LOC131938834 [Physella acuta]|uniref:uncharacterized protein LOC131938834 n=1 Tax=Physella acuta TaxID=109671 RepID=UPI0027DB700B|nr:uncharacterized protein LOC131938834 [Physella acuta]XP_059153029.1 uncharacterized protein LOC131938834 [Physella acuta]XP_059153031.1 uncharacterized protein LOC131938834 [Physella acuta]XP_059153032.1 uncharacterized protein LOC131938834 [Physella acuta]XP_059153033.1 uncharacterized protein LOC131938834 [Physella acuta]XP_059153034.1 uncharacterized protein LOC131938834 [Physella acuta]